MILEGALHRPLTIGLLASTLLSACTSWQVQPVAPEQFVATQHPSSVRVQRLDGSRAVVDDPRIEGESLHGLTGGKPIIVPTAEIYQIAVKRGDTGKSIGLTVGILVGVIVIAYIALASAWEGN
jgi:hypothetical protein